MVVLGASVLFSSVFILLPSLIPIMTPERFHQSADLVPILALGFIAQVFYMLFTAEVFYNKNTKYISLISATGLTVNLVFTVAFIGTLGVYAIAWANSLSLIAVAIAAYFYSGKEFLMYFKVKNIVLAIALAAITVSLSFILQRDAIVLRSLAVAGILAFFVIKFKPYKYYRTILKR
jgi:O-antigen/teichoic acid export membrane protein